MRELGRDFIPGLYRRIGIDEITRSRRETDRSRGKRKTGPVYMLLFSCGQGKPDKIKTKKHKTEVLIMLIICSVIFAVAAVAGTLVCTSDDNDKAAMILAEMNSAKIN